jgi:putative membrane protein insertion efficiency factor
MPGSLRARSTLLVTAIVTIVLASTSGQGMAIGAIHVYQRTLAPLAHRAGAVCRFSPSCAHYGEIAIARDGLAVGGWKTLKRIARCNPWTAPGTVDRP